MCGLFAYVGPGIDEHELHRLGELAERRGPDAAGLAWVGPQRNVRIVRSSASWSRTPAETWAPAIGATLLIGHARLATSGSRTEQDAQPIALRTAALAHNGVVTDATALIDRYGLRGRLQSACDSEIVGRVMEQLSGPRSGALAEALRAASVGASAALYLTRSTLLCARNGQPLYHVGPYAVCSFAPPSERASLLPEGAYDLAKLLRSDHAA